MLSETNKALCEARKSGKQLPIQERCGGGVCRKLTAVEAAGRLKVAAESMGDRTLYEGKVWQSGIANQNRRIYQASDMQGQVARYKPLLEKGYLCGAVDHLGQLDGGNLKDTCIIYRDLRQDEDGAAYATFEIVKGHSAGEDLRKQIDSGMAVGFSTFSYASGREPTPDEAKKYNLGPNDDDIVIMDDVDLRKIDAVDDPSVPDARINPNPMASANGFVGIGNDTASRAGTPATESAKTEACSTGLHWVEMGACGHKLSECKCEAESKHRLWSEKKCDKCAKSGEGLTRDEFVAELKARKSTRPVAEGRAATPLAKTFAQYVQSKSGDSFDPAGPIKLAPKLTADAYNIVPTWDGIRFVRTAPITDELYAFAGSVTESILKEIDDFWGVKENYEELGLLFHRGVMLYGPAGTGKTSAVHQAVEMICERGDVVFYGRNVGVLKEGLTAFREVEPDRKVVVILEDADEYVGYQEREMLNLLDGAESVSGILYLATTNYLNRFPERLLRPGRFDKKVFVGPPPKEGRKAYLDKKLSKVETAEEIERLATETDGLSFGHLRELITAVYALKEPKAEVLDRLQGRAGVTARADSATPRLSQQKVSESQVAPTIPGPVSEDITMDTIAELEQKAPKVFEAHKQAVAAGRKVVTDAIQALLSNPAVKDSIELPQREVLPAEFAAQLESVKGEKSALESKNAELTAKVAELQKVIDSAAAEKANADRLTKVESKSRELLKDNANLDVILHSTLEMAKLVPAFTATEAEAFIKSAIEKAPKIAPVSAPLPGATIDDEDLATLEDAMAAAQNTVNESQAKIAPATELDFGGKW